MAGRLTAPGTRLASARFRGALGGRGKTSDMTDQRRRVSLVTGSTDGLGKQTALELLRAGHQVIVHGRTRPKVEATLAFLRERVPGAEDRIGGVSFDLGSMVSVRRGAAELAE